MRALARRLGWAAASLAALGAAVVFLRGPRDHVACGPDFYVVGSRCCAVPLARDFECLAPTTCPPPLAMRDGICDAPDVRVAVPETTLQVGSSDWEAEGRVAPRTVRAGPFSIDAFEATVARVSSARVTDAARAASGLTRQEASMYCAKRGGRLPTEDEWLVAASGPKGMRYPWGETGAVCRRAAWGLASGPCAWAEGGPDTVGAHPAGDTPSGLHDMAGNVAEWVAPDVGSPGVGVAHGGSWQSALATEIRTWARLELDPSRSDPRVGVRCAYDVR
jgi:formylglycine-generating enzyme required for sulfatase activity